MKKFEFRLQSILRLKITLEEQGKARLAQLNIGINNVKEQIAITVREISSGKQELSRRLKNGESATILHVYSDYFASLKDKKKDFEDRLKALEEKKEQEQKIVLELMKERKALEKLKEKQYTEYLREQEKEQQMIINEFVSYSAASADAAQ